MYQLKKNSAEIEWTQIEIPGVSMRILHTDQSTGAMTVLTRLEAGAAILAHHHTKADETVYVLDGEFVEDDISYGPGTVFFGKAKTTHGPHHSPSGCTVITNFSAELDFVLESIPFL